MVSSHLFQDLELLAAQGKAVLYRSHVPEVVVQICNRVVVISKSRILADAPPSDLTKLIGPIEVRSPQLISSGGTLLRTKARVRQCNF